MEANGPQSWPKTEGGTTDWEVAFEDPNTGLIALIAQARSAQALRECVIVVIKMLFTRDTDPPEVKRFTAELTRMIPENTDDKNLALISEAVMAILRQIKEDRKKKAAEYEQLKETSSDGEKRDLAVGRGRSRWLLLILGIVALIGIAATAVFLLSDPGAEKTQPPKSLAPRYRLIEQMTQVAQGRKINQNAFGGVLKAGTMAGRLVVIAEGIPAVDCASVSWVLANRGNIVINGIMPKKVSPNVLSNLCSKTPQGATLVWFPKPE